MGTITIQANVERAWTTLNDTLPSAGVRWPIAEMLRWHNDGQRAIVAALPSAFVKVSKPVLQAGTYQRLQDIGLTDGRQVVNVHCNYSADGNTPGVAITVISKRVLDERTPLWHATPAGPVRHFCVDEKEPRAFWVWPQPAEGARVMLSYSAMPPEQTNASEAIALDDIYANALQYYLLMRAHSKNANTAIGSQQMLMYQQLFNQEIGVKDARTKEMDANRQLYADGAGLSGPKA